MKMKISKINTHSENGFRVWVDCPADISKQWWRPEARASMNKAKFSEISNNENGTLARNISYKTKNKS